MKEIDYDSKRFNCYSNRIRRRLEVVIYKGRGDTKTVEENNILHDELNNELILT